MTDQVQDVFTDQIKDPKEPMRSELERSALFELADNIKQNGLINPITVRPVGDMFEVVAGHRRLAACRIAGLIKIPVIVRELDDGRVFEIMAAENLEREDVDPVDESTFIERYIRQTNKSVSEVAKSLRRSVQWVETRLAISSMPDYMREYIRRGELKLGAALALVQISNDSTRRVWVDMAVRDGVSVAQAEYWLHGWQVSQLPGGGGLSNPPTGYEAAAAGPVMFRCAIDGREYDARTFKSVMIWEGNISIFNAFVKEFNTPQSDPNYSPVAHAPDPAGP